ncbi:MAG: hypothetical protein C0484_04100 [Rhodospirillum sp.]|nr:hypothetical protein [Rhodospirillum sp.]
MPPHFVVMGVPRSGTSALAQALNLHPEIMCGVEYIGVLKNAGKVDLPAAFEDPGITRPLGDETRALYLEKKSAARLFGDKNPWYYHDLPHLNLAVPACKKVCIYRRKLGFWQSWNVRAANKGDLHWARGQTGFFGLLELICLLNRLADVDGSGEVLMIDYDAVFFEDPSIIERLYAYLGAGPDEHAVVAFKDRIFSRTDKARDHVVDEARAVYDQLGLAEMEARIFVRPFLTNLEAAGILRDCCDAIRSLAPTVIREQISTMREAELLYFREARRMRVTLRHFGIKTGPLLRPDSRPRTPPQHQAIAPSRKNVVFLTTYPLAAPRHGGQIRSVQLVAALRRLGLNVVTAACVDPHAYPAGEWGPNDVEFPLESPLRVIDGTPVPFAGDYMSGVHAAKDEQAYQRILAAVPAQIDLLFLEQPWMLPVAQRLRRDRGAGLLVYDSQNNESALKAPILRKFHSKVADPLLDAIAERERAACREADLVFAVNAVDQAALSRHGGVPVQLAPNGVEPWEASAADLEKWRRQAEATAFALYVASAHPPNYLGFFDVLTDHVGFLAPDQAILVAGGASDQIARLLKGRQYEGLSRSRLRLVGVLHPADLAAIKQLAQAFVLPILDGSGSNLKTAEALFSGKWVVGTPTAFRGFERFMSMPHVMIAGPGRDFGAALRKAMSAPPPMLTAQDRQTLLELTWQETLAPMTAAIRAALTNAPARP